MNTKKIFISVVVLVVLQIACYMQCFYPRSIVSYHDINQIDIHIEDTIYHNDCLHPCIRYIDTGFAGYCYWMVQSPFYARNCKIENPVLFRSNDIDSLGEHGVLIAPAPQKGYNSDPLLFFDDSLLYVMWREYADDLSNVGSCKLLGVSTKDGLVFSQPKVYALNPISYGETLQSPAVVKRDSNYYIYAVWYEYEPERKNKGIAIWHGTSMSEPNFQLVDTIPISSPKICDKKWQIQLGKKYFFLPTWQEFDLWHMDVVAFEKNRSKNLYIIACAEWGDVIMLGSITEEQKVIWKKTPLVCNHALQSEMGYWHTYYKPTAFMQDSCMHIFYTTQSRNDKNKNILLHGKYMLQ